VALLVILALMGAGYTLLTSGPTPIRQVELTAVWATLGLIAIAVLGTVDPAISLVLVALVVAPLWYLTLRMSDEHARTESANTAALWREWRIHFENTGKGRFKKPASEAAPLSVQVNRMANNDGLDEEIELTLVSADSTATPSGLNLELLPREHTPYRRGRNI